MSKAKRPKYFTPNEVANHNTAKDIWVSFLGKVYDLTPLIEEYSGKKNLINFYKEVFSISSFLKR